MSQVFAGFIAEGNTDYRFLKPIIEKVLDEVAFDSRGQIDVYVKNIECGKGVSFRNYVLNGRYKGKINYGISLLIVHADADSLSNAATYHYKINPAKHALAAKSKKDYCQELIALVPIFELESWMLADKKLFKKNIFTDKSDQELNIQGHPETFTDPKERIQKAIELSQAELPKKIAKTLVIDSLYETIGESLDLKFLDSYTSYHDFKEQLIALFVKLKLRDPI